MDVYSSILMKYAFITVDDAPTGILLMFRLCNPFPSI
jgi:hypothetical protein